MRMVKQMNFDQELENRTNEMEDILKKFIPKEEGYQKTVFEAMNYSLLAGGKRLRPMLMLETYQFFGGEERSIIEPFMAALEMIHTYSLVHDDLPAMDNDEYRRGRKTTHIVFGEAMAILAGDGLLNLAFETAGKAFQVIPDLIEIDGLSAYRRIAEAIQILAKKAGSYGMIGGQVIDVEEYNGVVDRSRLDYMYGLKTGALIEAAMMIGAKLAGASEDEVNKIEHIAGDIGLAFQIKDDILDVTSSSEILGKPIHSDEKNRKITYVSIMDLDSANKEVAVISQRAIDNYEALPYHNEFLKALILKLISRKK